MWFFSQSTKESLEKTIKQLECDHLYYTYRRNYIQSGLYEKRCSKCDKLLGYTYKEEYLEELIEYHLEKALDYEEELKQYRGAYEHPTA